MASKNLYVGNLPFTTTQADLEQLFGQYGTVTKVQVISDRETGRSRGFGFVEMSSGADEAIAAMNGAEYQGRRLTVNEAKPREERPRGLRIRVQPSPGATDREEPARRRLREDHAAGDLRQDASWSIRACRACQQHAGRPVPVDPS